MPFAGSAENIRERLKASSHWKVVIRPTVFDPELIRELPDCWRIIEPCAVSLRGWDYPHVDRSDRGNGKDWIESWCDFMDIQEYWRFYQSGQFVHLFSFREDRWPNAMQNAVRRALVKVPIGQEPTGCMDVTEAVFRLTEIYEFASRLTQKLVLDQPVSITVELAKVRSRILTALDFNKAWWGYYPSTEQVLTHPRDVSVSELIGGSAQLAIDTAIWFFHRFQWNDPNRAVLQSDQQKLLAHKLA